MDALDRLPQIRDQDIYLQLQPMGKLVEHERHIARRGEDMPNGRNRK